MSDFRQVKRRPYRLALLSIALSGCLYTSLQSNQVISVPSLLVAPVVAAENGEQNASPGGPIQTESRETLSTHRTPMADGDKSQTFLSWFFIACASIACIVAALAWIGMPPKQSPAAGGGGGGARGPAGLVTDHSAKD